MRAARRQSHAEHVTAVASAVIDRIADPLRDDATDDRAELGELLAAIGETWSAALANPATTAEQLRWTRVCVTAQRIAQRLEAEIADEERTEHGRCGWCFSGLDETGWCAKCQTRRKVRLLPLRRRS